MKNTLKNLHKVLANILFDVDKICRENCIKYSLCGGTALGAVRHKGFIPWDDDIDIMMLRDDYEKFICVAEKCLNKNTYILQIENSKSWPATFTKVRLNNTKFIEYPEMESLDMAQGVYIDIFPLDNLSDSILHQKVQFIASRVAIAKYLERLNYKPNNIIKTIFVALCRLISNNFAVKIYKDEKKSNSKYIHMFTGIAGKMERGIYPRNIMDSVINIEFEKHMLYITAAYDEYLKIMYGNYMELPPKEQQEADVHAFFYDISAVE